VMVVGTPIGSDAFITRHGREMEELEQSLLDNIASLPPLQDAWLLLLYCGVPRANHLLRTVPPRQAAAYATGHDQRVLSCFEALLGLDAGAETLDTHGIARNTWVRQARLPLRYGGCGLRDSRRISPAAYWSSWADSISVLHARFPNLINGIAGAMDRRENGSDSDVLPQCLQAAVECGQFVDEAGLPDRPSWNTLTNDARPPPPHLRTTRLLLTCRIPERSATDGSFTPHAF
jgi:hypothetical protein